MLTRTQDFRDTRSLDPSFPPTPTHPHNLVSTSFVSQLFRKSSHKSFSLATFRSVSFQSLPFSSEFANQLMHGVKLSGGAIEVSLYLLTYLVSFFYDESPRLPLVEIFSNGGDTWVSDTYNQTPISTLRCVRLHVFGSVSRFNRKNLTTNM